MDLTVSRPPCLDPGFLPAVIWNRAYSQQVCKEIDSRDLYVQVMRPDGNQWTRRVQVLPAHAEYAELNRIYVERLAKFLLWAWGGNFLRLEGAPEILAALREAYTPSGVRAFDAEFMGKTCFLDSFSVEAGSGLQESDTERCDNPIGRHLDGCRIGFDLGGSDRKCAALIDGEVVFSEEVKWAPYFESDPAYHVAGIRDSLQRAAAHLPRVDAIGGSAAGIYMNNEPRVASLFRGLSEVDFVHSIRGVFHRLQKEWGNVPFEVANDGDVAALAGALSIGSNGVLGLSMGTSQAAGYIDRNGSITRWINELAFAPVDYRVEAPADEWSGDGGCGVQYFSQQAVGRLIPRAGLEIATDIPLPEQLEAAHALLARGDERAGQVFQTIGTYLGYSIAHYKEFYLFDHLLLLGRVLSGEAGRLIVAECEAVLQENFPEVAEGLQIHLPDEVTKRHGQAVAAASLPRIRKSAD